MLGHTRTLRKWAQDRKTVELQSHSIIKGSVSKKELAIQPLHHNLDPLYIVIMSFTVIW